MQERISEEEKRIRRKAENKEAERNQIDRPVRDAKGLVKLQQQVGNHAVQRMLAQRSGGLDSAFDLDDETEARINRERNGGEPLDSSLQEKMSKATGNDFSDVKVHNSPEAADLSQQVGATAFTTGNDIFFNQGTYKPQSGEGQELVAHELTHVVQQSSGAVSGGGSGMSVNAPGDRYEQEADAVAKAVTNAPAGEAVGGLTGLQRQPEDDELQMKAMEIDEEDDEALKRS